MHAQNIPELLQLFLQHTPVAVAMFDREMRYIATSRKWLNHWGVTEQSLIGCCYDCVLPSNTSNWKEVHERCLGNTVEKCDAQKIVKLDGSVEWLKWECHPWFEKSGEIGGTIFFTEVITDQKHTEVALQQSKARFQKLAANVPGMIYQLLLHPDGSLSLPYVSPSCRQLFEFEQGDIEPNRLIFYELVHPEDYGGFNESMAISAEMLLPWLWEGRIVTVSGKVKWVRAIARPERQEDNTILWDGLIIDISDRIQAELKLRQYQGLLEELVSKRTNELSSVNVQLQAGIVERQRVEAALRQSEKRFQKLAANIPGVIYQHVLCPDGSNYFSFLSKWCREVYELEPQQVIEEAQLVFDMVHPEDLPVLQESIMHSAATLEPWTCEWQITTPSGKNKWLRGSSRPEKQANGNIVWDGLIIDISDRKFAEEEQQKLVSLIENTSDFIGMATLEGQSLFINEAGKALVGLESHDQIKQIGIADFHTPEDWEFLRTEILPIVRQKGSWQGEFNFRHYKTGASIPIEYNIFLIKNQKTGEPIAIATISRDITQRKLAEEERQNFVSLVENSSDFIAIATLDGKGWYINEAGLELVGFENMEEFLQTTISDYHTPEDWEYFQQVIAPTVMSNGCWQGELSFRHFRTGELIPIEYNIFIVKDKKTGKPTNLATVTRDIRERKQAEVALRHSETKSLELARREQLINSLASQIRESLDLHQVIETAIEEIRDLLQIDRCSFSWFKPDVEPASWETLKEAKHPDLPSMLGCHPADKIGPVTKMFLKQEILKIDDVRECQEPMHKEFLESLGIKSEIVLPIKTRSGQIGVIVCGHWSETRPWADSEVELLQAVVDQLAIAINQAELYTQSQEVAIAATNQTQQLKQTLGELKQTQSQLVQSEKMSSLGQLVAGVAHEINNPVNFIYGNLAHASKYTEDLLNLLNLYQEEYPQATDEIQAEIKEVDLDFLIEDLPKIMTSMKVGSERIREIVQSLRTFSRLDEAEMKTVDIHEGIESTLMILQHRLKSKHDHTTIEIIQDYANLPKVVCYAGQLNQVFMNLLANAIDALEEGVRKGLVLTPKISITTEMLNNNWIAIHIADNGVGMDADTQQRLFDPFFTTKPVGVGTGLGLSISYQIVVDRHGGKLHCTSEVGKGTEFVIEIPTVQVGDT
jgi:PAS domain S-box-containing protein